MIIRITNAPRSVPIVSMRSILFLLLRPVEFDPHPRDLFGRHSFNLAGLVVAVCVFVAVPSEGPVLLDNKE